MSASIFANSRFHRPLLRGPLSRENEAATLWPLAVVWGLAVLIVAGGATWSEAGLQAGAAKIDITNRDVPNHPEHLWAKALVLTDGAKTIVLITVDAVAIGEIGPIKNAYLPTVRESLQQELNIPPQHVIVNASHCHGVVCADVAERTVEVVKQAHARLEPVHAGVGVGHENRIMENRRVLLKDGRQADVRHAYALPPDELVQKIGPVDPQIGVLKLTRPHGEAVAVIFNFACHPILGTPRTAGNTYDMTGYASQVIEDNLDEGTIALFVQGCAGDINPIQYKQVHAPRHAEPLGNMLGLSTLKAIRSITCREVDQLGFVHSQIELPRADHRERIQRLEAEQDRLLQSLSGTSLNFKTFVPLLMKYRLSEEFPSYYSHGYLHDQMIGRDDWERLDEENRHNLERYIRNIHIMEEMTRTKSNLALLKRHQSRTEELNATTVSAEVLGLKVGDFRLVTFPGELTVEIGLKIKQQADDQQTFVAGYTNGYLYYAPTDEQLNNPGCAQEDSDCLLGPGWLQKFENQVQQVLQQLTP